MFIMAMVVFYGIFQYRIICLLCGGCGQENHAQIIGPQCGAGGKENHTPGFYLGFC